MPALQLLRGLFLLFTLFRPIHGLVRSPCADKDDPAPISINLGMDAITAVCAESRTDTSTIATVVVWDDDHQIELYRRAMLDMRKQYYQRDAPHLNRPTPFKVLKSVSKSISKAVSYLTNCLVAISGGLVILSGSELLESMYRHLYLWASYASRYLAPVLARLNPLGQAEIELLSHEELKTAFLQAFHVLKNVSMEESGVDITSSLVLIPAFLEYSTHRAISKAAHEAGIFVYWQLTPQQMITRHGQILDESSADVDHLKETQCDQNLVIIDYGFYHFDVQIVWKRHRQKYPMDFMGHHFIVGTTMMKIISDGQVLREEYNLNDSSKKKLFLAVGKAILEMKEQVGYETWEEPEEGSPIKEWPIKLKDWSNGEDRDLILAWSDVKDVEAAYMEWLKGFFALLMEGLEGVHKDEAGDQVPYSETVDKVIVLGNWQGRSLVSRAVRDSFGAEARIIGARDEQDITLEAQGGARLAWSTYEEVQRSRAQSKNVEKKDGETWVHEEL